MTFLPHDKIILTSKGVTYNIIYSKVDKYLHGLFVIFIGALFILATIMLLQIKIEFEYNGFQLLNLMLRWPAKILLFGDNNGWNYYFPDNIKELYFMLLVLWVMVEMCCSIYAFEISKNSWDRVFSFIFFLMIFLPDNFFYFCAFLVLVYEFACVRS